MSLTKSWRVTAVLSRVRIDHALGIEARVFLIFCLTLGTAASAFAACPAPHYRPGYVWEDSQSTIMMNVSIRMADFAPDRLICLTQTFKERYGVQRKIKILIFSTRAAAEQYTMPFAGDSAKTRVNWAARMYASYFYTPDTHEEYLSITPDPLKSDVGSPFVSRIDLPIVNPPPCKFQIHGRCLLALDDIDYPSEALKERVSGKLRLTGTIDREGKVTGIRVAQANATPTEKAGLLTEAAVQNLGTWRLEEAKQQDALQITLTYVIDSSLPHRGDVQVKIASPNEITVRAYPLE
jgi:Gram-negative bacterial TonB protein C-terminal